MKRAIEFSLFIGVAAGVHLALASYAPEAEGAQAAGNEGVAVVSLQASDGAVAELVEAWDAPPQALVEPVPPPPPQTTPAVPQMPQQVTSLSPPVETPSAPGLSLPSPETVPDQSVTADPPPPPKPELEARREELAGLRPKLRPKIQPPAAKKQPAQKTAKKVKRKPVAKSSSAQKARGQGGGANAGAAQQQRAATLSASQRQSLTAQWGAQVRRKIERRKRYPVSARGAAGTVTVRITVSRGGGLQGVSLAGSSGNRALDAAALRAVRAARTFPPAPRGLSNASYTFTLPMRFSS